MPAGARGIHLGEGVEQVGPARLGNADPGVANREGQLQLARVLVLHPHRQRHRTPGGELDRVADQVQQHLGKAQAIPKQRPDRFGRSLDTESQPLVGRLLLHDHPHPIEHLCQFQRLLPQR